MNIAIIGGGLFGRIAADLATRNNWSVTVFDDARPLRASACAGCLFKPSWLVKLRGWATGVELLEDLYGVDTLDVDTFVGALPLNRVNPYKILGPSTSPIIPEEVKQVDWSARTLRTSLEEWGPFDAIYIATGVAQDLVPPRFRASIKPRQGATLYYKGEGSPKLKVWAPYKQSVSVPVRDPELGACTWFGDGTVIKPENWTDHHSVRAKEHAQDLGLDQKDLLELRLGIRPMYKPEGHFARVAPNCFLGTGGGKNGVVLAALFADRFVKALEKSL